LIDLPPGTGDIHLSIVQAVPVTGAIIVSTPQNIALADAKKGVAMFKQESINVPVLGIVENMSYFTPAELPNNKYYIFGQDGAKNLAKDIDVALNEEEKEATVTVPEDQLSLAIGRDGQNVRLAAKLTGWKIDIQGKPVVGKEEVSTDKPKEEIQVSPDQPIVEVKEPEKQEVVKEEKVEPVQEASVEVVVETPKTETVQADTTPSV